MLTNIFTITALSCYLAITFVVIRQLMSAQQHKVGFQPLLHGLGFIAVFCHGLVLYALLAEQEKLNFALMNVLSLAAWVVVTMFLITALRKPISNLGVIVLPLASILLLVQKIWPGPPLLLSEPSTLEYTHIVISLLAYSLMAIAATQGILLLVQEKHIRQKHPGGFVRALPPMETMEVLMFQMIAVGFLLLTLTLISGLFFSEQVFGKVLQFNHHIILSIISWCTFLTLLVGRWRFGWRGRIAAYWTLGGFAVLMLAYFGTKFVLEVLKQQGV
jgi:ABC-type uncharacterized transport system permease subunit